MSKLPAFQFYPGDHLKDPELSRCSPAARGVWWDMISQMFGCEERGVLSSGGRPWSDQEIAAAVRGDTQEVLSCLRELLDKGVAHRTESGAVYCRRMVRDEETRRNAAARQSRHRHGDVTPMSQRSSSSSSTTNHKIKTRAETTRGSPQPSLEFEKREHEQRRNVQARDNRLQKEAEAHAEARVGSRAQEGPMPARPDYLEFASLRDHGRIQWGVTWSKWKTLTPAERDELLAKPGPQAVRSELDLKKVGST